MISSGYLPSCFFVEFESGINCIRGQNGDNFHNKLYFSNVVSLMEKYLYDLFIHEISTDRVAMVKLGSQNKFKSEALKIPWLLHNRVEDFIINATKNLVWHRLNDVNVLYKSVLDIPFEINGTILKILKTRHDIVHRNGYDLEGVCSDISGQELTDCIDIITKLIRDIDKKYHDRVFDAANRGS